MMSVLGSRARVPRVLAMYAMISTMTLLHTVYAQPGDPGRWHPGGGGGGYPGGGSNDPNGGDGGHGGGQSTGLLSKGKWTAPDDLIYDFSPILGRDFKVSYAQSTIAFAIDRPLRYLCGLTKPNAAACQSDQNMMRYNAGVASTMEINYHEDDDGNVVGVKFTYSDGDMCLHIQQPRSTTITFICDPQGDPDEPTEASEPGPDDTCIYEVRWRSPYGCAINGGLSTGWVFIIVLVVSMTVYLGGGIAYKTKRLGAQGIEAVPNIDFWRNLPSLVWDGCLFFKEWAGETYARLSKKEPAGPGLSSEGGGPGYSTMG